MFRRSALSLLLAVAAVAGLSSFAADKAEAANPGMSAKIVVLQKTSTHVKFKVTGTVDLGPVHAVINTDPMIVKVGGTSRSTLQPVPGLYFRITATRTTSKLQVKCEAWTYVLGQKISATETKSVSIN